MKSCPSLGLSIVGSHRTGKDRVMEEMFRWLFIGFIAGLWLSLEEAQCEGDIKPNSNDAGHTKCCSIRSVPVVADERQDRDCGGFEIGKLVFYSEESEEDDICKVSDAGEKWEKIDVGTSYTVCSADNQFLCIIPGSQLTSILKKHKSRCFNSSCICCTVCREANLTTTSITTTTTTTHSTPTANAPFSGKTDSTLPTPHKPPEGQRNSSRLGLNKILIVLTLLVVVVFIIVAVVLFMRKRKSDKRNEWSPTTYTSQGETVTNVYADNGTSGGTAPAGNHIYDELDVMTLDPTPSNVYSTQPTSVSVDMGRSADYVDIDLPMKDQQKPMNSSNAPLSLSPVYSQPFESETSASNTEYAEPFQPDTTNTATAPFPNHNSAAGDQQNDVYSLAKAIPLSDPNVIYSQPNKPIKSSEPTGEVGGATDPIHSETIGVVPGAGGVVTQDPNVVYAEPMRSNTGAGGVITQDPNAVYAEPMKLKKTS